MIKKIPYGMHKLDDDDIQAVVEGDIMSCERDIDFDFVNLILIL